MIDVPIQVKDALRDGRMTKNYRFVVLNEDGTESEIGTIDNNNLVSESVSIDERMCSGDTLKFGLCEGSSLEFQYFGKPSITGLRVRALVDIDFGGTTWGEYDTISGFEFNEYEITKKGTYRIIVPAFSPSLWVEGVHAETSEVSQEIEIGEKQPGDVIAVTTDGLKDFSVNLMIMQDFCTIPLGYFTVKKCSRQASTGIIKVTAYNKLQSDYLDIKANDQIAEIVAAGEVGVPGSATIDTILMKLLDGYVIEPEFSKATYTVPATWSINQGNSNRFVTINDKSIYAPLGIIRIDISHLDPNGAYRFFVDRNKVRQMLRNAMGDLAYQSVKDPGHSSDAYTSLVDVVFGKSGHDVSAPYVFFRQTSGQVYVNCYIAQGDDWFFSDFIIKKYTENAVEIWFPMTYIFYAGSDTPPVQNIWQSLTLETQKSLMKGWSNFFSDPKYFRIEARNSNAFGSIELTNNQVANLPDVTLRDLQTSVYELSCQFGQLSRETDLFQGVELNRSALYPADTLYPANSLYPDGAQESSFRSQYSKLWADEGNVHKWRNLIITYKGLDENQQPKDFTLQRQVNADGTDDYNCSDNWLFRNLVWTSEQIAQYADVMVAKMQPITWFPFEMWGAGLPYLETGDQIEIPLGEETYTSYILQRNLKGIQNLQDTYINGTLDIF